MPRPSRTIDRWAYVCDVASTAPGPRLTASQRAVFSVIARHENKDPSIGSFVGQDTLAAATDMTDRGIRKVLTALVNLGLIIPEHRPGKTTRWNINWDWTPEPEFQTEDRKPRNSGSTQPRNSSSDVQSRDPGTTPELPRNPSSDEVGRVKKTPSLSLIRTELRGEGDSEEVSMDFAKLASSSINKMPWTPEVAL